VATGIQGSGWAVLGWDSVGGRLLVFQLFDQQANVPLGVTPLLMLDMWEHAFYLDYLNVKAEYVKAFWNLANWSDVSGRLDRARAATGSLITAA
jgi:Fe-Mn family superoxide dismutase